MPLETTEFNPEAIKINENLVGDFINQSYGAWKSEVLAAVKDGSITDEKTQSKLTQRLGELINQASKAIEDGLYGTGTANIEANKSNFDQRLKTLLQTEQIIDPTQVPAQRDNGDSIEKKIKSRVLEVLETLYPTKAK